MRHATATLVAGLMRKESFADAPLDEAMARYVISPTLYARATSVSGRYAAELVAPDLLQIRYTTRLTGLSGPFALTHTHVFPLRNESRRTGGIVRPGAPEFTSAVLVALSQDNRGYVNVSVYDDEDYLIRSEVLTYNRAGGVRPYLPVIPDKFSSPLPLGEAHLGEAVDGSGRRVLRLTVELAGLTEPTTVKVGYSALGIHTVREVKAYPHDPIVVSDLVLDDNPELLPGEWVIGVTDGQDRMLVNGIVRISPGDPAFEATP